MKQIMAYITSLLMKKDTAVVDKSAKNFFDYSSGERIKILRAAGKEAQKEQSKLLEEYKARFM